LADGIDSTLTFPSLQPLRLAEALEGVELAPPARKQVEDFYQALHQRVYRFGLLLIGNEQLAEDMMQEAFLRFYTKGVIVDNSDQAYAWLTTVVRNLVRDRYRRQKTRPSANGDNDLIMEMLPHPAPSQEDLLFRKQRLDQLQKLVSELDGIEKECILLYSQGLTFQQMADTLGISLTTAINKTTRAMKLMTKRANRLKF
jgi:RNA polymerase sigma-70 factor (ECF subfamily)